MSSDRQKRRTILKGAVSIGLGLPVLRAAAALDDPAKARPESGDILVYDKGDRRDQPLPAKEVPLGGPVIGAYPMDPDSGTVRRGSRLNRVVLVRLDPATYDEKTLQYTTDGIVAYSAFCTHQGCPINDWDKSAEVILCHCHNSRFDPRERGRVVFGPARRRLAMLPIELQGETLVVAAPFVGKVGVPKG